MPTKQVIKHARPPAQDPASPDHEADAETPRSASRTKSKMPQARKRKRQGEEGEQPVDKASAKRKSKKKKSSRKKTRVMDATFIYDPDDVEPPTEADFTGLGALSRRNYPQREPKQPGQNYYPHEDGEMSEPQVLAIPDVDDDSPQLVVVRFDTEDEDDNENRKRKKSVKPRIVRRAKPPTRRGRPVSEEFIKPEDESGDNVTGEEQPEQVPAIEEPYKREPPNLMNIPVEIRNKIYRELLVVNKAISVHGGWRLVYKRNKLDLPTNILRVCGQVHDEAARILYGENTFLYRLRDPINAVTNVDLLATDDTEPLEGDEGDSGSEWEGAPVLKRRKAAEPEWDINIDKYSHLFRSITVEAEHNRYSEDTQESMAKAINVFAKRTKQQQRKKQKQPLNLRTLTIRVTPLWNPNGGHDGSGAFTFVDFFKPQSPILAAMQAVECQFLRVDLLTRYMGKSKSTPAESGACRLTMDRRYERILNMVREAAAGKKAEAEKDDWWAKDNVMQWRRRGMARKSAQAVEMLAVHVERECTERDFEARTTEDGALGDGGLLDLVLWDELTDDEGDF